MNFAPISVNISLNRALIAKFKMKKLTEFVNFGNVKCKT